MDISYELYKVFYYVATSRSFSEAGSKLFISQSAVSQSVRTLERRLGQTLFVRKTKRVTLTKEGEMLDMIRETVVVKIGKVFYVFQSVCRDELKEEGIASFREVYDSVQFAAAA